MYLKNIIFQDYGPLRDVQIDLPFDETGNPSPMILVGLNGSGKSLTLSVILDALVSMRRVVYADVPELNLLRLKSKGSVVLSAFGAKFYSFPTEVGGFKPICGK